MLVERHRLPGDRKGRHYISTHETTGDVVATLAVARRILREGDDLFVLFFFKNHIFIGIYYGEAYSEGW